jgi:hypothetical protein
VAAVWVRFHSEIQAGAGVGSRAAGKLCLPNGKLRRRDFLYGEEDAQWTLDRMLAQRGVSEAKRGRIDVALTGIAVKLCARDWGVFGHGDRETLTGTVRTTWGWRFGQGAVHEEVVAAEMPAGHGRTPQEMIEAAMAEVATRIATSAEVASPR